MIDAADLAVVERAMDAVSEGLCHGAAHCDPALHEEADLHAGHGQHGGHGQHESAAAALDGAGHRQPAGTSAPGH